MKNLLKFNVRKLCLALLFFIVQSAMAQNKRVTGIVTDVNKEPIIGASVTVKGWSGNGVVTDQNGKYAITVPAKEVTLVFSYIGFHQQEQKVGEQGTLDIVMKEDNVGLDEVVVIGYGSVKRKDLTGAVASVRGDKLAAVPVNNVAQALQGKLPGVNVVSSDGRPDATISVRVRGGGSITQSNEPLYVVDGFPVSSISDIPASEIESIDVLKDASSTAIYGARGANGVILVGTKKAEGGRLKVSYNGYVQAKNVVKTLKTLTAQEYVFFNWGYGTSRGQVTGDNVAKYFGLGSKYGNHYADYADIDYHDYTKDLLRTAWSHSHNVSLTGGTEKTNYQASVNYISDKGIKINSDIQKFSVSLKLYQQLLSNLSLDFDFRYVETLNNGREGIVNGRGSEISGAYRYRPIDHPLGGIDYTDVNGWGFGIQNVDNSHNPVDLVNDVTNKVENDNLRGSAAILWKIIKGLQARTEINLSRSNGKTSFFSNGYEDGIKDASLNRSRGSGLRWLNTITYQVDLSKKHSLNFMLGHELLRSESEYTQLNGNGYPNSYDYNSAMGLINTATQSYTSFNYIGVPDHTVSFFGRANYSLFDRYLFTVTMRADGSSKFAPGNRWGYFPAAAFAWRLSDEPFMAKSSAWLSNLKLRFSYGTSGTDNISSDLWRETWKTISASNNNVMINGEKTPYYAPDGLLANNDLKWETTISRNLGVDYGFFDGKINGSMELYWNTTKDLLMAVPVDNTTGYSYQYQNFGQISNRGIELSIDVDVFRTKDIKFSIGSIYNYNRNRVDKLENADNYLYSSYWASSSMMPVNDYMLAEGMGVGVIRGFKSAGFYTVDDFNYVNGLYVLKHGVPDFTKHIGMNYFNPFNIPAGQTAFPGAAKFQDIDDDGTVTENDVTSLGEVQARNTGSFYLNFQYKNWDLGANFNWVLGGKIYNAVAMLNASGQEYNGIAVGRLSFIAESFKCYNVDQGGNLYAVTNPTELAELNANTKYPLAYHQSGIVSDQFIESGSYLRLQTLTLGYTIPKTVLKKIHLNQARLYFTASNLFTITGYSGVDPEVNSYRTGQTGFLSSLRIFPTLNMDWGAYPRARTFTLGTNIIF